MGKEGHLPSPLSPALPNILSDGLEIGQEVNLEGEVGKVQISLVPVQGWAVIIPILQRRKPRLRALK